MKPIANAKGTARRSGRGGEFGCRRSYDSQLRQEQASATRTRILDAFIRTMARGLAEVSIPAVAREAGVSVPTIYRHFGSKRELFAEVGPYAAQTAGLMPYQRPWTLDEEPEIVRSVFRRSEDMDETVRAAMGSRLGHEMRQLMMPARLDMHRRTVMRSLPDLPDADVDHFARVLLLLHSSAMLRAFKEYLGMGAAEAAEDVAWATQALQRGAANLGASTKPGEKERDGNGGHGRGSSGDGRAASASPDQPR